MVFSWLASFAALDEACEYYFVLDAIGKYNNLESVHSSIDFSDYL
jgi:hypothetical protein